MRPNGDREPRRSPVAAADGRSPPAVRIRRGGAADASAAASLYARARRAAVPHIPPCMHDDDDVARWIAGPVLTEAEMWLAEANTPGEAAAGVTGEAASDPPGEAAADPGAPLGMMVLADDWLEQLYVEPALTGRGIGSRLLAHAMRARPGGLRLWTFVTNTGAQRFYVRHGFREVRRTDGAGNEERAPDILFAWTPGTGRGRASAPGKLPPMPALIDPTAERYAEEHTSPLQGALAAAAAWTRENTDSPGMMSGLAEARLLQALIVVGGARRVLEIGTFTGVGTVAMAGALPEGGRVITLERDPDAAAAARRHIDASGFAERVELVEGDALASLPGIDGPFDLVYIDAWKSDYPAYLDAVLPKLAPRGVIVGDNLFRAGRALDPAASDEGTAGIRDFARQVQADARLDNVLLTIGDGVMLAWAAPGGAS